jgi:hypothetical protein
MTQAKKSAASLLRIELQLLEQLFIEKFVQGASGNELMPLRRQIMVVQKKLHTLSETIDRDEV